MPAREEARAMLDDGTPSEPGVALNLLADAPLLAGGGG